MLARGNTTVLRTHNPPVAKMPQTLIFCLLGNCRPAIMGIGSIKVKKPIMMLIRENAMHFISWSMQLAPDISLRSQVAANGLQPKMLRRSKTTM